MSVLGKMRVGLIRCTGRYDNIFYYKKSIYCKLIFYNAIGIHQSLLWSAFFFFFFHVTPRACAVRTLDRMHKLFKTKVKSYF